MQKIYSAWAMVSAFLLLSVAANAQVPSQVTNGICSGVVANFNTSDNGFNSPSVYGSVFDSSFYYHAGRGYWTDYLPPYRTTAPGFPRVMNIISPPFANPNPSGTFNIGFHYIVPNASTDRFQVRIISVTQTSQGTVTNVEASSGVQFFASWPPAPTPYVDVANSSVPDPTPYLNGVEGNICLRLIDPDIVNGPSTTFRVEISYLINEPLFAVFDDLSIGPQNIPLPVDFIGLVADRSNTTSVNLRWDVGEEVNVREYQVERSGNGANFTSVASVPAKGKSVYSVTNYDAPATTLYYRVKSVDIDGRTKYSGILKLSGSNSFSNKLKIYPVPATDQITAQHGKIIDGAKLTITSAEGRIAKIVYPRVGSSNTQVDISTLAPGIYLLQLDDGRGEVQSAKLVKN